MISTRTILIFYWVAVFCSFFLSYVPIGLLPPVNYLVVCLTLILFFMVYYGKLGYIKRNELFIFSFLLSLLIAATLKYHGFALSYIVVKLLKSVLIGSVLSLSAYIVVCLYGLKSAAKPFVFCAMITSVIAIFQSIGVDYAWFLRV